MSARRWAGTIESTFRYSPLPPMPNEAPLRASTAGSGLFCASYAPLTASCPSLSQIYALEPVLYYRQQVRHLVRVAHGNHQRIRHQTGHPQTLSPRQPTALSAVPREPRGGRTGGRQLTRFTLSKRSSRAVYSRVTSSAAKST